MATFLLNRLPGLLRWIRRDQPAGDAVPSRDALDEEADQLADASATEIEKSLGQLRRDSTEIGVTFTRRPVNNRDDRQAPDGGTVGEVLGYYQQLEHGRLVITGEAGAGKSYLARELARQLLDQRALGWRRPDGTRPPVPVVLSLVGWNSRDVPLDDWIVGALAANYRVGRDAGTALVRFGRIMPVLDGLDDVLPGDAGEEDSGAVFKALDEFMNYQSPPMVVTFRRGAPTPAGSRWLNDSATIALDRVGHATAAAYIRERALDPAGWTRLLAELPGEPRGPVATILGLPLWLNLAVRSADPGELLGQGDEEQTRWYLLGKSVADDVDACARAGRPRGRYVYVPEDARRWLETLAARGPSRLVPYELWTMSGERFTRAGHAVLSFLSASAATLMLTRVIVGTPSTWLQVLSWAAGLSGPVSLSNQAERFVSFLFFVGLPLLIAVQSLTRAPRPHAALPARLSVRPILEVTALILLCALLGLVALRNAGMLAQDGATIFAMVLLGACLELAVLVLAWRWSDKARRSGMTLEDRPGQALRSDLFIGLLVGVLLGALTAGTVAFGWLLSVRPSDGQALPLATSLATVFGCGLVLGFLAVSVAWTRYAVMVTVMSARGRLPIGLGRFLEQAEAASVLRRSGAAYQFRHDTLRGYLRDPSEQPDGSPRARLSGGQAVLAVIVAALSAAFLLAVTLGGGKTKLTGPPRPPDCAWGSVCNRAGAPAPLQASAQAQGDMLRPSGRLAARLPAGTGLYIVCYHDWTRFTELGGGTTWVWVNWTSTGGGSQTGWIPLPYVAYAGKVLSWYHTCSPSDFHP